MIDGRRIPDYIDSLIPANSDLIEKLRARAVADNMPVIGRDGEQLLKTLLRAKNPKRIFEIGTCVGYSAIVMADSTEPDCHIFTCEIGEADYKMALANIENSGFSGKISCFLCDASEKIEEYAAAGERFDFVFMDAAKGQYINWLPGVTQLLETGGILLSDNIFAGGYIAESRFAVERRDRTTHARLRAFLYELTHSDKYTTSVINAGDGMSISVRR